MNRVFKSIGAVAGFWAIVGTVVFGTIKLADWAVRSSVGFGVVLILLFAIMVAVVYFCWDWDE